VLSHLLGYRPMFWKCDTSFMGFELSKVRRSICEPTWVLGYDVQLKFIRVGTRK
jgi:hypothetical protein